MNLYGIIAIIIMISAFFVVSLFMLFGRKNTRRRTANWIKTTGVCVDYRPGNGLYIDTINKNSPIISYMVDGREYFVDSQVRYSGYYGGNGGKRLINKKFKVLYNPANPNEAVVLNSLNLNSFVVIVLTLAIIYMFVFLVKSVK